MTTSISTTPQVGSRTSLAGASRRLTSRTTEDSFILLDAMELDAAELREVPAGSVCVEIGFVLMSDLSATTPLLTSTTRSSGSGIASTFLGSIVGRDRARELRPCCFAVASVLM